MDIFIFVVALSILVLVHEFGHYFAAKITGVKVEEFGLGLPPRIFGKKIGETVWSLNWLPIGGFCRLYGEDGNKQGTRAFNNKNPWQKGLIVLGGVLMNLVLAVVIFSTVYTILGVPKETDRVKIIGIAQGSPAQEAGLREDDWIKKVGEVEVKKGSELTQEVEKYKGKSVILIVGNVGNGLDRSVPDDSAGDRSVPDDSAGDRSVPDDSAGDRSVRVEVREKAPEGEGLMGIVISNTEMEKVAWWQFYKGIGAGFREAYFWGEIIFSGVVKMVGSLFAGDVPKDVSGPLGIFEATSSIRSNQGLLAVIHFFGIVSVNLAVVNVLPFPALDGGRIIFVLYEIIFRKRANEKFEVAVNNLGMLVLLTLLLLITVGDVSRLISR